MHSKTTASFFQKTKCWFNSFIVSFEFPNKLSAIFWLVVAIVFIPLTSYLRFGFLANPLVFDPHGRQSQTALTTYYFAKGEIDFFKYVSPLDGALWNQIHEFPLYQWICAQIMRMGVSLEVASRSTTLFFFIVSVFVFAVLIYRLLGKQASVWATLFYLIIPLNVTYSRSGMIDIPAMCFMLCCVWMTVEALRADSKHLFWLWVLGVALSGALASLIKATNWFIPVTFLFLSLVYLCWKKRIDSKKTFILLGALLFQLVVALIWFKWASEVGSKTPSGYVERFIGPLSERFDLKPWLSILYQIRFFVLHDWLILPFLFGVIYAVKKRHWLVVNLLLLVLPIVILFPTHARNHNYYYLISMPSFVLFAAYGMLCIFKCSFRGQVFVLAIMSSLLVYRTIKIPHIYGPIYSDLSDEISFPLEIKRKTSLEDIIALGKVPSGGGLEIPLYSERYLNFSPAKEIKGHPYSVYILPTENIKLSFLARKQKTWIVGVMNEWVMYRVKEVQGFEYDPQKYLSVTEKIQGNFFKYHKPVELDSCQDKKGYTIVEMPEGEDKIRVKVENIKNPFWLPRKKYLVLPSRSEWGCKYQVSL